MENDIDIGYTTLDKLQKIIDSILLTTNNKETQISFEFLIGSLFPESLDKIRDLVAQQYIQGYKDGRSASLEEQYELRKIN